MKLVITFLVIIMSFSNAYATKPIATKSADEVAAKGTAVVKIAIKVISAEDLVKMQKEVENLVVIDSRGGKYFDGVIIKGAINLPVTDTTEESLAKIVATKDTPIVFYCTNKACPASSLAAYKAKDFGYKNLYKFEDGIEKWISKKFPTEKTK